MKKKGSSGNQESVDKFRYRILDMHRGVPDFRYYGFVEKDLPDKEIRDYFIKEGVFVKSKHKHPNNNQDQYFLGVNGIILANNYKMEELTSEMKTLTNSVKVMTFIIIFLTVILVALEVIPLICSS